MCAQCLCNLNECTTVKGGAKASGLNRRFRTLGNPHKFGGYPSSKKRRNTQKSQAHLDLKVPNHTQLHAVHFNTTTYPHMLNMAKYSMCGWSRFITHAGMMLPTLDGCTGSKFLGTNLNSFEANWILELDLALDPSLHLGSSNHELSFLAFFFWVETNWFSLQNESYKLDPPPLDENAWPKSCKIKAKYCDQCFGMQLVEKQLLAWTFVTTRVIIAGE